MPIGSYKTGLIALTDAPVGIQYAYFGMTDFEYFNIHTRTFSGVTVTLEGTLDDINWRDVTSNLFGGTTLSANNEYLADTYMTYKDLRIKLDISGITNTVQLSWMVKKGGGR